MKIRFVSILLLVGFACTLAFGLFVGWNLIAQELSFFDNPDAISNVFGIFAWVILSTVFLFVILKYYKGSSLFQFVEYLLYFSSGQIFASLFVSQDLALVFGILVAGARFFFEQLRPVLLLFTSAVVGGLLGSSLGVVPAIVLGVGLSFYDLYAVFYSKHMISLAQKLSARKAAFAVSLKFNKESITLGTGDLVMPVMLAVAFLKVSPLYALASVVGSFLGLLGLIFLMEKKKGYYPALPPIVFGALAASALVFAGQYFKLY